MSREPHLEEVRVERNGRNKQRSRTDDFVYVNNAFVGSVDSVNTVNATRQPNDRVYREQYCVCSRWPHTKAVLAVTVGVILGALIGLGISFTIKGEDQNVIGPIFKSSVLN